MSIISYAQNFEDVMLWRALGHVPNGFYIDVGAQHPVVDSVSKAFYEHGWRGTHVEATPRYAELLRQDRPDETVLQTALSDRHGTLTFYEIPDTGLSTGDRLIAEKHQAQGFVVQEITVPCITLADVFAQAGPRDIHWLKVDVEGMEPQVLAGWGEAAARPWVLVVESTYPNSQIETHAEWQGMVLERNYREVYFDGLSRFYVPTERNDIAERFNAPPNIFDGFALASTAPYNGPIRELIKQTDQQAQQQQVEQARLHCEQAHAIRNEHTEREQLVSQKLQAAQQELQLFEQDRMARDKENADQAHQMQQELDGLLRSAAQREQQHSQQLLQLQQQINLASTEQHRFELEQRTLVGELTQKREEVLDELRQQHAGLLDTAVSRERELVAQLLQHQQQALQAKDEHVKAAREVERSMARTLAQRDQELQQQLKIVQKEARQLALASAEKEKSLAWQAAETAIAKLNEEHQRDAALNQKKDQEQRDQSTKNEQALVRRLSQSEQVRIRQAESREAMKSGFAADRQSYIDQLEQLTSIAIKQHGALTNRKKSFWKRNFSPFNAVRQAAWIHIPNSPSGAARIGMPNLERNTTMSLVNRIAYQPTFEVRPDDTYELDEFQRLYDKTFVIAAYRAILRRDPDAQGETYYLERVRKGISRHRLLAQIMKSPEALKYKTSINGVKAANVIENFCDIPILGNMVLALVFLWNIKEHLKDLRALENHMVRTAEETHIIHQVDISRLHSELRNKN